jgi:transposase
LAWSKTLGDVRRAVLECTGSYGASLSRLLQSHKIEVVEVNQPDKHVRRTRDKTDAVDAEAAARAVLSGRATATAKAADARSRRFVCCTCASRFHIRPQRPAHLRLI